jgi:hypothetical protein
MVRRISTPPPCASRRRWRIRHRISSARAHLPEAPARCAQRAGLAPLATALNRETDSHRIAELLSAEVTALFRLSCAAVLVPQARGLVVLGAHGLAERDAIVGVVEGHVTELDARRGRAPPIGHAKSASTASAKTSV